MKTRYVVPLAVFLGIASLNEVYCIHNNSSVEIVSTDAGNIDFSFVRYIRFPGVYHKIQQIDFEDRQIDLEDGSRWSISKVDTVKGWDRDNKLLITQNHAGFSTSRYALVNLDRKSAIPVSLAVEPAPNKSIFFVKGIDVVNDVVALNDSTKWIAHSSDRSHLNKMKENDRVIIGVNTGDDKDRSPYVIVDTANNYYIRAQKVE